MQMLKMKHASPPSRSFLIDLERTKTLPLRLSARQRGALCGPRERGAMSQGQAAQICATQSLEELSGALA